MHFLCFFCRSKLHTRFFPQFAPLNALFWSAVNHIPEMQPKVENGKSPFPHSSELTRVHVSAFKFLHHSPVHQLLSRPELSAPDNLLPADPTLSMFLSLLYTTLLYQTLKLTLQSDGGLSKCLIRVLILSFNK